MRGIFTGTFRTCIFIGKVRPNIVPIGGTIRKPSRNFVGSRKFTGNRSLAVDLRQVNPARPSRAGRVIAEAAALI